MADERGGIRRELDAALDREAVLSQELAAAEAARREAAAEARRAQDQLRRLTGRRSVRVALRLASLVRPLFRLLRGRPRGAGAGRASSAPGDAEGADAQPLPAGATSPAPSPSLDTVPLDVLDRLAALQPVTIVVPVKDAADAVRRCLASVLEHTTWPARLVVVDDASQDADLVAFLDGLAAGHGHVRALRNEVNRGYTASVNRAIAETTGDVVLLNSDTVVGPRWLQHLALAAQRHPTIATATALTDNAGAFSVPVVGRPNPVPAHLSATDAARLVAQASTRDHPATPTANGFCVYLKRAALDTVGTFDEAAFPRGYGEENDFSLRAAEQGWRHVVDDATLVLHERGASTGGDREELIERGRRIVDERHPQYTALVRAFLADPGMARVRERIGDAYERAERPRTRVLYVHQEGTGGVPATSLDLARALDPAVHEPLVLTSNAKHVKLHRLVDGELEIVDRLDLRVALRFLETTRDEYRRFVAGLLVRWEIELVHVRHLVKHTLDVPGVAAALGVPVVLSFHDYYLTCPTVNLLDHEGRFCAARCTAGQGTCPVPFDWLAGTPHLKHGWVHTWRGRVREHVLAHVDACVTTSATARDVHQDVFPELTRLPFALIPHGRDVDLAPIEVPTPAPGEPLRVLLLGNLGPHKGTEVVRAIRSTDPDGRFAFHLLGRVEDEDRDLGVVHGTYAQTELRDRVARIRPHVAALLSTSAETWSHALTEAWALGLPVVVSDRGALRERVEATGGGWVVDVTDPAAVLAGLARASDPAAHAEATAQVRSIRTRTAGEMARDYEALYARTHDRRASLRA